MVILLTILYVIILSVGARSFARGEGYYSTVVVFGITGFIYYMLLPLELALGGIDSVYIMGRSEWVPPRMQWKISALGTLGLLGFLFGYYCSGFVPHARNPLKTSSSKGLSGLRHIPPSLVALGAGSLLLLFAFYRDQLAESSSYAGHVATVYHHPLFTLLAKYAVLSVALIAGLLMIKQPARLYVAVPLVIPIVLWGLYSSDKNPILLALLALAACFFGPRSQRPRTLILILMSSTVALLLVPLFSLYRAGVSPEAFRDEYYFAANRIDAGGPMYTLISTLHDDPSPRFGATYLRELLLLVPKVIWPDRPPGAAEEFAESRITRWQPGGGLGFSPLAEAYANFWWFGPFIQYFAFAFVWGKVGRELKRRLSPRDPDYWNASYSIIAYYLITLLHRNSMVILKGALQLVVPLIVLAILLDWRKKGSSGLPAGSIGSRTLFNQRRSS